MVTHTWPYGSVKDEPLSLRAALIWLHATYCVPKFVPIVRVLTITAWIIAVVAAIYAHAAG